MVIRHALSYVSVDNYHIKNIFSPTSSILAHSVSIIQEASETLL